MVEAAFREAVDEGVDRLQRSFSGLLATGTVGGLDVSIGVFALFAVLHLTDDNLLVAMGWRSFALAMFAGMIITLMTWMEVAGGVGARVVGAVVAGSLLAIGEMNHSIVASLEMFAGLIAGAPYGYLDWLGVLAWAVAGNAVGGIGLVTILRLVQAKGEEATG